MRALTICVQAVMLATLVALAIASVRDFRATREEAEWPME